MDQRILLYLVSQYRKVTVLVGLKAASAFVDGCCESFKTDFGIVPTETRIGDTLSVHQLSAVTDILVTFNQVTLDHDTHDVRVRSGNLTTQFSTHIELSFMLFLTIGVTHVNHESWSHSCIRKTFGGVADRCFVIVSLSAATS